ncbi:glycoside hydrolase family 98 domain-containing protein [Robbsia andropogonis]|uniref:glycoside hydrolase family 98 domain-containing protein n=1 Tax=Robbsia andropogonis TaxID=28092 RepID=UPI002A6B7A75|nr:glycoside hydrolase family 98 domain-containing protein [Robbsia andropogonis]
MASIKLNPERSGHSGSLLCLLLTTVLVACGGGTNDGEAVSASESAAKVVAVATPPADPTMRRTVSPEQPLFLIHVDTWNQADPQKVIDLIPPDIRPYAVLNLSLSIDHNGATGNQCNWTQVEDGIDTARSWMKTAAQNGIWAMIQPSSGGFSQFPDYAPSVDLESTVYGEFFRDYPNFLGFNYAEQFWGFGSPCAAPSAQERWEHWSNLLKLTNKYGGLLAVSFTGGYYGAAINPLAMVKRDALLESALRKYSKNFIIQEKFTSNYGFYDNESVSMGMWLSGYAGSYGIRTDRTGWYPIDGSTDYPIPAGSPHLIEHLAFTGETVFDGPELIWLDAVKTLPNGTTADGYTTRLWDFYPHYRNIHLDIYRKILDGTLRILSRQEVVDRTKMVIVNDVTSGNDQAVYSSPDTLFQDLYSMDGNGILLDQHSWYKKTGRYPAIPTVWQLTDSISQSFSSKINKSTLATRWPTSTQKLAEFNALFPQEYSGDIYAGRQENTWVTYNPYKTNRNATGNIPFKYNTCSSIDLNYTEFTSGVIKEYPDKVTIYLTNYDDVNTSFKTQTFAINGATVEPTLTFNDRGDHQASQVTTTWSGGVYTVTVSHNGPLDINLTCSGSATDRLTAYKVATIVAPASPAAYTGPLQYEAEYFDFKNIGALVSNGVGGALRNYQGLGYLNFGGSDSASIRDTVTVPSGGAYTLMTRYVDADASVNNIDLYVNGIKVATPLFAQTTTNSDWATDQQAINLNAGKNIIEFRSNGTRSSNLYFDNIVISK